MKKQVMSAVLAVLLAGGWYAAQARPMAGDMAGNDVHAQAGESRCRKQIDCKTKMGCRQGGDRLGPLTRMADELGLDDSQRQQVESMIMEQRERDAPLREKLADGKRKLWEASKSAVLDETLIADLAAEQGRLMSEMMLSRIRLRNQIYTMLTPQQQEKAANFDMGRGPGCGVPGCGNCQDFDDAAQPAPL
ncbi:MAG: Spy/CpxP family protein refolding chaperone [Desulfobulbaceae bacterium]|nr:Spy/CpxP family protein refolding chaperone [Desulfobulbaceae bacterium]